MSILVVGGTGYIGSHMVKMLMGAAGRSGMIKLLRSLIPLPLQGEIVLESQGHCSTCNQEVSFVAKNAWLRDHFRCSKCGSIPRERALMQVVEQFHPN